MIIWFVVPMLFSMFDRQDWHPSSRPRQRKDQWKRRRPGKGMTREDPFTPRPLQTVQVVEPAVSPTPSRKLDGIPSSCQACGGPANETTIRWRGTKPSCGYCSSGL
jgi:hypothetical protein